MAPQSIFHILVLVTDSEVTKKFAAITRRRTGIYLATHDERYGGFHVSYHGDGAVYFRAPGIAGPDPPGIPMPRLSDIQGYVVYPYASLSLTQAQFDRLPDRRSNEVADCVISFDRRALPDRLDCRLYLIEPGSNAHPLALPVMGHLICEELVTQTSPWILLQFFAPP